MIDLRVLGLFFFISLLSQGAAIENILEIKTAKFNSVLGQSLLRTNHVNEIASRLVRRVSGQRDIKGGEFDYIANTKIYISFYEKSLKPIVDTGCFLNAHQIGKGSYTQDLLKRASYENKYIDLNLNKSSKTPKAKAMIDNLRPKYAFLEHSFKNLYQGEIISSFGGILARVSDSVKGRSTFSLGDQERENGYKNVFTFGHSKEVTKLKTGEDFWEVQVWGDLCLEESIDYFLVGCFGFLKPTRESIALLLNNNYDVYMCKAKGKKIKKGMKLSSSNLELFASSEYKKLPSVESVKVDFNKFPGKINVELLVKAKRLSYCEIIVKNGDMNLTKERDFNTAKSVGECKFSDTLTEEPDSIEVVVKDAYGNIFRKKVFEAYKELKSIM